MKQKILYYLSLEDARLRDYLLIIGGACVWVGALVWYFYIA